MLRNIERPWGRLVGALLVCSALAGALVPAASAAPSSVRQQTDEIAGLKNRIDELVPSRWSRGNPVETHRVEMFDDDDMFELETVQRSGIAARQQDRR